MEVVSNLLQAAVTLLGFGLGGIRYLKSRKQEYFLLTCFYGCFFLGSLYWTLYLLLFSETPQVFYVSEFGWVASVIFLSMLQYTLSSEEERRFPCRKALSAVLIGVPLCIFYCTFGDILSNLLWCGMMIVVSYSSIRGLAYARRQRGAAHNLYGIAVTDRRPVHGKTADKIFSVLPCRNGGVSDFRLYQYLFCRALWCG